MVILEALKKNRDFHTGHSGISRTKTLLKSYVFWPNKDKDIDKNIKSYSGCAMEAQAPPVKFNPSPRTEIPQQRPQIDFAGPIQEQYYLIVVDIFFKMTRDDKI